MSPELKRSEKPDMTGDPSSVYGIFEHGPFSLEYLRFGNGPRPVFAFHGYGRRAEDFAIFFPHLASDITLYSFNLFGHGRTRYPEERLEKGTISKREWASILRAFLDNLGIERAAILGYSLGGRMGLCLLEQMPERTSGAYLFAPDGLQRFSWYRCLSRIPGVQALLRRQIERPTALFRSFGFLKRIGAIDRRTHRFLLHHTRTKGQRKAVYEIWNMHRDLVPDLKKLRRSQEERSFILRCFFGRKDPVIPPYRAKVLGIDQGKGHITHILEKGHLLLDKDCIIYLNDPSRFDDPLGLFS